MSPISSAASISTKRDPKKDFLKKCFKGDVEAVKSALKAGADVNCTTSNQDSYLIAVLKENNPKLEIVEIIINAGADVNYQEPMFGTTALMHVRNLNMAKLLIKAGADPSIRDFNGHLAYEQYHFYLYEELEDLRKYLNACYENTYSFKLLSLTLSLIHPLIIIYPVTIKLSKFAKGFEQ